MTARSFWLLPALVAMAACSSDTSGPDNNGNTDGRLQVVPGVAALAAVDVVVDGQTRLTNVPHGVPSTPIPLSLGVHQVKVVAAGTAATPGGTTVTLREGDTTRVVVIGTPTPVFRAPYPRGTSLAAAMYDVAPDGRFVVVTSHDQESRLVVALDVLGAEGRAGNNR